MRRRILTLGVVLSQSLLICEAMTVTAIEQGVTRGPFLVTEGTCAAFVVRNFQGGKHETLDVSVWDSERKLDYLAVGFGRYEDGTTFGDPATLASCSNTTGFTQGECWGPSSSNVYASALSVEQGGCDSPSVDGWTQRVTEEYNTFTISASDSSCKALDGDYYLYLRAKEPGNILDSTRVHIRVDAKKCRKDNKTIMAFVIGTLASICCLCGCVSVGVLCALTNKPRNRHRHFLRREQILVGSSRGRVLPTDSDVVVVARVVSVASATALIGTVLPPPDEQEAGAPAAATARNDEDDDDDMLYEKYTEDNPPPEATLVSDDFRKPGPPQL